MTLSVGGVEALMMWVLGGRVEEWKRMWFMVRVFEEVRDENGIWVWGCGWGGSFVVLWVFWIWAFDGPVWSLGPKVWA